MLLQLINVSIGPQNVLYIYFIYQTQVALAMLFFCISSSLVSWSTEEKKRRLNKNRQGRKDNVVPSHSGNYRVLTKVV